MSTDRAVDPVEPFEKPLVGIQPQRREAVGRGPERIGVLRIGGERRHDRERDPVRVVVADGIDQQVEERAVGRPSTAAP